MVTGSRGIHVVVPLRRRTASMRCSTAAQAVAAALVATAPDELTTEFRKAKRGDRLFVDVLRNRWAQTVAAPYAPRARPFAPVAMPVRWAELETGSVRSAAQWPLPAARERVEAEGDAVGRPAGRGRAPPAGVTAAHAGSPGVWAAPPGGNPVQDGLAARQAPGLLALRAGRQLPPHRGARSPSTPRRAPWASS